MNATCDETMATARGSLGLGKIIPALITVLRYFSSCQRVYIRGFGHLTKSRQGR